MTVLILQVEPLRLDKAKASAVIDEQTLESRSVCLCALALGGGDSRGSESPKSGARREPGEGCAFNPNF